MLKISVINGPNLNMLGDREVGYYGAVSLEDINAQLRMAAKEEGIEIDFYQSNSEGELVTFIQTCKGVTDGIIINPGAYTHTSIAIRDALLAVEIPFVEVHLSNVYAREEFRKSSYLSDKAVGVITGFGSFGYIFALEGIRQRLNPPATALC